MQEIFSPQKLIIFGLVFLFFFSIPVFTVMQIQKANNEKKIKYDLRQLESWAEVYKMKNGTLNGFNDDIEIKMLKIDLTAITGNSVELYFDDSYNQFCIKAVKDKDTYCLDGSGIIGNDGSGCKEGTGVCK